MAAKGKAKGESMAVVDAPLPLVTVDAQGKFVVGPEASTLIRQIKGDIAVIAVAGIYRFVLMMVVMTSIQVHKQHFFKFFNMLSFQTRFVAFYSAR